MNKDPNVEKQIEELARSFCGLSKTLKCSECSYECYQKEYARKAFEAGYRLASEVAEKIFEEIERVLAIHFCSCLPKGATEHYDYYEGDLGNAIAELKKKYTEDSGNENHN